MYNIHLLPASFGDSILIEYGDSSDPNYILIDGGPYFVFDEVIAQIKKVVPKMKKIDLLVITHIDIDHIDGIIVLLNQNEPPFEIGEIWFNGWNEITEAKTDLMGGKQGEYLSALIKENELPHNTQFGKKGVCLINDETPPIISLESGMEITLLSPTSEALADLAPDWENVVKEVGNADVALARLKEDNRYDYDVSDILGKLEEKTIKELQLTTTRGDKSAANGSSIAFIANYEGKRCLFSGDAHSEKLERIIGNLVDYDSGERLKLDAWKLSHHGSRKSTLSKLMTKISCKTILISSDGKRYKHPDVETIAKIFKHNGPNLNLYFNYKTIYNEMWDDVDLQNKFQYNATYPDVGELGITIKL